VRVLNFDERGRWVNGVVARLDRRNELLRCEDTSRSNLGQLNARVGGRSPGLVPDRVCLAADDHIVAGPSERAQRNLVRHGAARQPERGFFSQQPGDALLQRVHRRIVTVLVITDVGCSDRRSHRRGWTGDRIRAQVDGRRRIH
jgi:hypothetical protein